MITNENGLRIQTASEGFVLKSEDNYSKLVYLGEGAQPWEEVLDEGQSEQSGVVEDVEHEEVSA